MLLLNDTFYYQIRKLIILCFCLEWEHLWFKNKNKLLLVLNIPIPLNILTALCVFLFLKA